ncbi:MAG: hypothetical protein EKK61_02055, partial [Rickettsiales bacterium]
MKKYDKKLLEVLILRSGDIAAKKNLHDPKKCTEKIEKLLKKGANPDYCDKEEPTWKSCLEEALDNGDIGIIRLMAIYGANLKPAFLDKLLAFDPYLSKEKSDRLAKVEFELKIIQKIDEYLEKGEFDNITSYDQDLFAG